MEEREERNEESNHWPLIGTPPNSFLNQYLVQDSEGKPLLILVDAEIIDLEVKN